MEEQPRRHRILAFDIGIKNLAFCILENSSVIALQNCNILGEEVQKIRCALCKSAASYKSADLHYCKRHLPSLRPILADTQTKEPYSKIPPVPVLRTILQNTTALARLHRKREDYLEEIAKRYALPIEQPKQKKAATLTFDEIHTSLRNFVQTKWELFSECTDILLENQPVFKNPHMKTVQIMLYVVLREAFMRMNDEGRPQQHSLPSFHLVHAKKKVTTAPKGDEGYAERKAKSEDRLIELFTTNSVRGEQAFIEWKQAKKKSDMADALCMCVDWRFS